MDDDQLAAHMTTLNDEQLSDVIAAVDAAEVVAKAKPVDMLASALWYVRTLRWPVFPLKPNGKKPLTQHGFKDATLDPEQVTKWWTRWPDANIGVPTGHRENGGCGYDVLDIDGREGLATLVQIKHGECQPGCCAEEFCPATGSLPTIVARAFTPGDGKRAPGRHYYTPAAGGTNTSHALPSIDTRGTGGYVCVPPSVDSTGRRYSWLTLPPTGGAA